MPEHIFRRKVTTKDSRYIIPTVMIEHIHKFIKALMYLLSSHVDGLFQMTYCSYVIFLLLFKIVPKFITLNLL